MMRITIKFSPTQKAPFSEFTIEGDLATVKGEERRYWALMRKWTIGVDEKKPNIVHRIIKKVKG